MPEEAANAVAFDQCAASAWEACKKEAELKSMSTVTRTLLPGLLYFLELTESSFPEPFARPGSGKDADGGESSPVPSAPAPSVCEEG